MSGAPTGTASNFPGSPFVGREPEQARLRAGLQSAVEGRGQLILLSGEPGIGKTRLAEWLAAEAGEVDADVLWGRCYEGEGAPAFWPWSQILRSALPLNDTDALQTEAGADAAHLAQILPEIEGALPDLDPLPPMNPEQARFRLFDAVTRLLKQQAGERPLAVILEDLHWADAPTLLLLQFLAQELRGSRLLVLGTYRNVEVQRQHPLSATLASLVREPVTERITLHRFTPEEVAILIEQVLGTTPAAEMAEAVWRETEGNPFFVTEVVLLFDSGEWSASSGDRLLEIRIPESIRDVVGQRLDRLSPECNELLSVAAVAGREFDLSTLETVTGNSAVDLLPLLDEASQSQIIESGEAFGQYRFSHRLIQETLYDELPTSRRFQLHSQIGASLEERHAADLRDHYGILAHHYSQAPLGPNIDKAIDYATMAAERALRQVAWEEAVSSYELALQVLGLKPNATPEQQYDLLLSLGTAQGAAGSGRGNTPGSIRGGESQATFWKAVEAARNTDSPLYLARAAWGLAAGMPGFPYTDVQVVDLLQEALAALPPEDSVERALVTANLAAAYRNFKAFSGIRCHDGTRDEIERLSVEALEIARRISDPVALGVTIWARSSVAERPRLDDEVQALGRELGEIGETIETGHVDTALFDSFLRIAQWWPQWLSIGIQFLAAVAGGEVGRGRKIVEELAAKSAELRTPQSVWLVQIHRAGLALGEGRFVDAEALLEEADAVWPNTGIVCNQTFALCREQDRLQDAESRLKAILDVFPESPWFRLQWIMYLLETGNQNEARQLFEEIDILDIADLAQGDFWSHVMVACADLSGAFEDAERAAQCYELLETYPDHIVYCSYIYYCGGSISHYLGLLSGFLGEWQKAEAHFEQALEQHQSMGFHPLAAHTQHAWAGMLLQRGEAGDRERAEELLDQASETADRLGMIRLQRLIAETREEFGPEADEVFRFDLSQREVEVLRLVVEGMTDGEIAEELYLSPRTISTYLSSIYNKLGVNSRAAAAAITVRSGLA